MERHPADSEHSNNYDEHLNNLSIRKREALSISDWVFTIQNKIKGTIVTLT